MATNDEALHDLLAKLFKAHPWHGVVAGADVPTVIKRLHRNCSDRTR
jgi:hypothetical protein